MPLRPPWALTETEFITRCTRCGDCVPACPTGLLQGSAGNFPVADFSHGHCDFCTRCVDACQTGALLRDEAPPWNLIATIEDSCLTQQGVVCRSCGEHCDAGAIRFPPRAGGVAQPQLSASDCTGCGECLPVCPTRSISIGQAPVTLEAA